jgi:excisionase family DNA binding protein
VLEESPTVRETDETLSVTAVAKRLGISRSMVWRMIADGYLDAESVRHGRRLLTRVEAPRVLPGDPPGSPARSRTMRLQAQVDRLTQAIEVLTDRLIEAEREHAQLREELQQVTSPAPAGAQPPVAPEVAADPFPAGITARPNPMTHPATVLPPARALSRDEALAPLRALFEPESRRGAWWQRLAPTLRG